VIERLKAPARRLLRQRGYTVFRDRPPRDLANPLPVELAAHRLLLRAVLERREVNCVIDVGAHTGGFASELREAGYAGEIVSVEPIAESFEALSARTREDPRWRAHRLALGSAEGRARMHVARQSNFTSLLRPTPFSVEWFGGSAVEREEEVEVQRLDAVFASLVAHVPRPPRVLLKTDTHCWDLEVIEGAGGCLDRVVAIQVELSLRALYEGSVDWLEALATLRKLGFRPAHLTSVGRDAGLGVVELDCLLIRES
jgi:FkbM family methyltransferase